MSIDRSSPLALVRLMQLISPSLPIGGFSFSQGLEFAVECGWVRHVHEAESWLEGLLQDSMAHLEIPVLKRIYIAIQNDDIKSIEYWSAVLLASRETSELRQEEIHRAKALHTLIHDLEITREACWSDALQKTQLAPYALAAVEWSITLPDASLGFAWSTVESQVAAAVKLVPLGQTEGQKLLFNLSESIPYIVADGLNIKDAQVGASAPAMAIASSQHETQYTRLFRS